MDIEFHKALSEKISAQGELLSKIVIDELYASFKNDLEKFGAVGYEKSIRDVQFTINYLAESISLGNKWIFTNYIGWLFSVLTHAGVPKNAVLAHLAILNIKIGKSLSQKEAAIVNAFITAALTEFENDSEK